MAYPAFDAYVAPARRAAEPWRTVAGLGLIVAIYVGGLFVYLTAVAGAGARREGGPDTFLTGDTPGDMVLLLASFLPLLAAPLIVVRLAHRRRPLGLLGSPGRAVTDFAKVAGALILFAVALLPLSLRSDDVAPGIGFGLLLVWLPLALPAILVQVSAEELVFRGYLQQQLGARFGSPAVWMICPALLFAAGHYAPDDYGANALALVGWAFVFGLFAADLTARTGTLGAAIGLHFATNVAAFTLIGLQGNMDGLALWQLAVPLTDPGALRPYLLVDLCTMATSWLLARLVLRV